MLALLLPAAHYFLIPETVTINRCRHEPTSSIALSPPREPNPEPTMEPERSTTTTAATHDAHKTAHPRRAQRPGRHSYRHTLPHRRAPHPPIRVGLPLWGPCAFSWRREAFLGAAARSPGRLHCSFALACCSWLWRHSRCPPPRAEYWLPTSYDRRRCCSCVRPGNGSWRLEQRWP